MVIRSTTSPAKTDVRHRELVGHVDVLRAGHVAVVEPDVRRPGGGAAADAAGAAGGDSLYITNGGHLPVRV